MCPNGFYCPDPAKSPILCPAGTVSSTSEMCAHHTQCYEQSEKMSAMNFIVGTCSYKYQTNVQIKKIAGSTSLGKCAAYVREAVQRAKGETV